MSRNTEQEIRERAYHLWIAEGCPDGRDDAIWLRALELQEADEARATPDEPSIAVAAKTPKADAKTVPAGEKRASPKKASAAKPKAANDGVAAPAKPRRRADSSASRPA